MMQVVRTCTDDAGARQVRPMKAAPVNAIGRPHARTANVLREAVAHYCGGGAYSAIGLPEASFTFDFHCVLISDTTDSGSEM